jgi:hypothetical protein
MVLYEVSGPVFHDDFFGMAFYHPPDYAERRRDAVFFENRENVIGGIAVGRSIIKG